MQVSSVVSPASDEEILARLHSGHSSMIAVLSTRMRNIQVVRSIWSQGKYKVRQSTLCPRKGKRWWPFGFSNIASSLIYSKRWSSLWIWRTMQRWRIPLCVVFSKARAEKKIAAIFGGHVLC